MSAAGRIRVENKNFTAQKKFPGYLIVIFATQRALSANSVQGDANVAFYYCDQGVICDQGVTVSQADVFQLCMTLKDVKFVCINLKFKC